MATEKPVKRTAAAATTPTQAEAEIAAAKRQPMRSAADVLGLDPVERPNKALTEGPEGAGSVEERADYLTKTLAHTAGGGPEAQDAARAVAEDMASRQVDEVPSRAEREAESGK